MANLTKEQRLAKEAEMKAKMEAEIEAKLRAELEAKLRAEYEAKLNNESKPVEEKTTKTRTRKTGEKLQGKIVKVPLDTVVPVVCNAVGGLVYESQRNRGAIIRWDSIGSIEYLEVAELVSMRNTSRRFFEDNWVVLEDADDFTAGQIYEFLKVSQYYKNVFTSENIDEIFEMNPKEIVKVVSGLSKGMKDTIASRAKEKIDAKELDSSNKIDALETALNVKFSI